MNDDKSSKDATCCGLQCWQFDLTAVLQCCTIIWHLVWQLAYVQVHLCTHPSSHPIP